MATDPSACRHCGISERGHYSRYMPEIGYHQWTEPTWPQRRQRIRDNISEMRRQREANRVRSRTNGGERRGNTHHL